MNALSRLITKVTKRQFAIATTPEQMSELLDRTVRFAETSAKATGEPYLSESELDEIVSVIPVTEPVSGEQETLSEATEVEDGADAQEGEEIPSESLSELESMTKAELIDYANERGIEVSQSWTKAEIIAAIREAA